ncbi:MAG: WGR domain-containing protein [Pseudomonadota bacterium]
MSKPYECREHWQAVDNAQNIARDYRLTATPDLFGWTIVERQWGRIGSRGQSVRDSFPDEASARRFVRAIRQRRASAQERIGVAYRPIHDALPSRGNS